MLQILVVLVARDFQVHPSAGLSGRQSSMDACRRADRRQSPHLNRIGVDRRQPFDDALGVTHDLAYFVQPRFPIQVRGLDDERIAFPAADRIALPQS